MSYESVSRSDLDRGFEAIQKLSNFRINLAKQGRSGMIGVIAALIATGARSEVEICQDVFDLYGTDWDDTVHQILAEFESRDELPQLWEREGDGSFSPGVIWNK